MIFHHPFLPLFGGLGFSRHRRPKPGCWLLSYAPFLSPFALFFSFLPTLSETHLPKGFRRVCLFRLVPPGGRDLTFFSGQFFFGHKKKRRHGDSFASLGKPLPRVSPPPLPLHTLPDLLPGWLRVTHPSRQRLYKVPPELFPPGFFFKENQLSIRDALSMEEFHSRKRPLEAGHSQPPFLCYLPTFLVGLRKSFF